MNTVLTVGLAIIGLIVYIVLSMLLHAWFTDTVLYWVHKRGITPRYGLIAVYRWADMDPSGEEGLSGFIGPLAFALVPLGLLELGLRLLLRRLRPTTPTTFLA